jgi:ferredoxin
MSRKLKLIVDPTMCDGHGLCAELLPELIRLDPWGYPIIAPGEVPLSLQEHAQRAVAWCPRLALHLVEGQSTGRAPRQVPVTKSGATRQ